jgi:IclR family transcriptional regulator, acetate operon repressor
MPDPQSREQPLDRIFLLMEAVARAGKPTTITEIAAQIGLPPPTVHRLVAQLVSRDLLKRALDSKRVLVGPRLVDFGARVLKGAMLADQSHLILSNLANELGEHCQVGIVAEGAVLYVDTARADRALGLQFQPGRRAPLHCTSMGKLFLASLPETSFEEWLSGSLLKSYTGNTITDRKLLRREIAAIRLRGWASNREEYVPGVSGCAVPLPGGGSFVAGLGTSAPSVRLDSAKMKELVPRLSSAAEAIAQALDKTAGSRYAPAAKRLRKPQG